MSNRKVAENRGGPSRVVLASSSSENMMQIENELRNSLETEIYWADTADAVMAKIRTASVQLVVVDERLIDSAGIDVVRMVAAGAPFVTCALVSNMAADEFHEQTEGLGVLMQLPAPIDQEAAVKFCSTLQTCNLFEYPAQSDKQRGSQP